MRRTIWMTGAGVVAVLATAGSPRNVSGRSALCTVAPGRVRAVVRVERDTTLPNAQASLAWMSASGVAPGAGDSLLATPETPMPAGRVRLLRLDSATRAALDSAGITDSQPVAYLRARPYRADCRTVRYTDTVPFVVPGETGYVRATLAPREHWVGGAPLLVIPQSYLYPYPRRRSLAFRVLPDVALAPPEVLFDVEGLTERPDRPVRLPMVQLDSAQRERVIAWARANLAVADLEPVRALVRRAILDPDWRAASEAPSRLRGTYRVQMDVAGRRATWYFRTMDRPGYPWRGPDSAQTTASLLASPFTNGYQLVGIGATHADSLPAEDPFARARRDRVPSPRPWAWLSVTDRPTAPGNAERRAFAALLSFRLVAVPDSLWDDLEPLVPRMHPVDSAMMARMPRRAPMPRSERQPVVGLTVRLGEDGVVRGDTTLVVNRRRVRVTLDRLDTLSYRRPF